MKHDARLAYAASSEREVRPSIVEMADSIETYNAGPLLYYTFRDMANRLLELIITSEAESGGHLHSASSPWLGSRC
jgi:hypothetical protein